MLVHLFNKLIHEYEVQQVIPAKFALSSYSYTQT